VKVTPTDIPDVLLLEPAVHRDTRGFFLETWHATRYVGAGIGLPFVQDNHSRSVCGTLRGLHYQVIRPQGKLVTVVNGEIFDVAVDLRRASPTFGRWAGVVLSDENQRQLWVPPGFAHGFYVTSESADVMYKFTDYYAPEHDRTLRWDDADVGIAWPLVGGRRPLLSPKDAAGPAFRDAPSYP
jgi:dTDP-4-dehydrorhamnose 3,5-epimerase